MRAGVGSLTLDRMQGLSRVPIQAMFLLCNTDSFPTPPLTGMGLFWGTAVPVDTSCVCMCVSTYVSIRWVTFNRQSSACLLSDDLSILYTLSKHQLKFWVFTFCPEYSRFWSLKQNALDAVCFRQRICVLTSQLLVLTGGLSLLLLHASQHFSMGLSPLCFEHIRRPNTLQAAVAPCPALTSAVT